MKISSEMNVISLVSWGGDIDEGDYYKIYGYTYDGTGHLRRNTTLDKDSNLSGYNTNQSSGSRKCAVRSQEGFDYRGKQYDPVLNEPIAVSAETHGDFWEDDMDYSEAVSYEGINTKAGVQAKTDEKT